MAAHLLPLKVIPQSCLSTWVQSDQHRGEGPGRHSSNMESLFNRGIRAIELVIRYRSDLRYQVGAVISA